MELTLFKTILSPSFLIAIIEAVLAFLIGCAPFGIYVCKHFNLKAPNTYGSRNIGASNVARQHKGAGALTLLLDALKGAAAILILSKSPLVLLSVVAGHCYSPIMNYNGGKGVATALGALLAFNFNLGILFAILWIMIFYQTRTPKAASVSTAVIFAFYSLLMPNIILLLTPLLIIIRHRKNVHATPESA